ncbi:MAG: DUF255 domain-containing protein [Lutibacter sp.]
MPEHKFTNSLIKETSPYLLQHDRNPVNWHAWNKETLALAKKENKLLLAVRVPVCQERGLSKFCKCLLGRCRMAL